LSNPRLSRVESAYNRALRFITLHANSKKCCVAGASEDGGNVPGLSATQSAHARAIISEAKNEGLAHQGCLAGITTGLTEVCHKRLPYFPPHMYIDILIVKPSYLCK
jgi:hypothetical protein